jgi:hypothetical protein
MAARSIRPLKLTRSRVRGTFPQLPADLRLQSLLPFGSGAGLRSARSLRRGPVDVSKLAGRRDARRPSPPRSRCWRKRVASVLFQCSGRSRGIGSGIRGGVILASVNEIVMSLHGKLHCLIKAFEERRRPRTRLKLLVQSLLHFE